MDAAWLGVSIGWPILLPVFVILGLGLFLGSTDEEDGRFVWFFIALIIAAIVYAFHLVIQTILIHDEFVEKFEDYHNIEIQDGYAGEIPTRNDTDPTLLEVVRDGNIHPEYIAVFIVDGKYLLEPVGKSIDED